MLLNFFKNTVIIYLLIVISCGSGTKQEPVTTAPTKDDLTIFTGASQLNAYLPYLKEKKVGIVANQTSVLLKRNNSQSINPKKPNHKALESIEYTHLVDTLLKLNIEIKKIFSPEHGFRGTGDAGEHLNDEIDKKTGLPILSLHGKTKKPTLEHLKDIDIMVFDIQDVGVRFYTYLSNLHYVMEACAENNIPLIVLDRPNPNSHYIDGPVLDIKYKSYVGLHPVPLVYGMTIGEYAQMINGESWLENSVKCNLSVIKLKNYSHNKPYSLPIKPSPNLPNDKAINLYPSLDIFRGTPINVGRGTDYQMQIYGAPFFPKSEFSFIPKSNQGAKYPRFKGEICYGVDLRKEPKLDRFTLKYVLDAYKKTPKTETFFGPTWTIHAGNEILKEQIEQGLSESEIRATWQKDLETFKVIREKYLIYK